MTVADWVAERAPDAPEVLRAGIATALGAGAERPAPEAADVLLDAAEQRLAAFLPGGASARDGAVPLLIIDALVTLALEAAADRPAALDARARAAMLRLAAFDPSCA